jgi:hypothetical protein
VVPNLNPAALGWAIAANDIDASNAMMKNFLISYCIYVVIYPILCQIYKKAATFKAAAYEKTAGS